MFGNMLHAYARGNGLTFAELGKRVGVSPTLFSKWKGGRWDTIPEDMLVRVIEAVTKDPAERGRLMMAYLLDITPDRYRGLIEVAQVADKQSALGPLSNPGIRPNLEAVAAAYTRDDDFKRMCDTVFGWAKRINDSTG
jgi:transcriptional regulator with XRE-family HTH domain